jgi:hypothetical protein
VPCAWCGALNVKGGLILTPKRCRDDALTSVSSPIELREDEARLHII